MTYKTGTRVRIIAQPTFHNHSNVGRTGKVAQKSACRPEYIAVSYDDSSGWDEYPESCLEKIVPKFARVLRMPTKEELPSHLGSGNYRARAIGKVLRIKEFLDDGNIRLYYEDDNDQNFDRWPPCVLELLGERPPLKKGDRVKAKQYSRLGTIVSNPTATACKVRFDDGHEQTVLLKALELHIEPELKGTIDAIAIAHPTKIIEFKVGTWVRPNNGKGRLGQIKEIDPANQRVLVHFADGANWGTVNDLEIVPCTTKMFNPGDDVQIVHKHSTDWVHEMDATLGKYGRVVRTTATSVLVEVNGNNWWYLPTALVSANSISKAVHTAIDLKAINMAEAEARVHAAMHDPYAFATQYIWPERYSTKPRPAPIGDVLDALSYGTLLHKTLERFITQENTVNPIKLETKVFIDGTEAKAYNNDALFEKIRMAEDEINRLSALKNRPAALEQRIADLQKGIDALVEFMNKRDRGDDAAPAKA